MLFEELFEQILDILPEATVGEDSEGQLVIFTNLTIISSDGHIVSMGDE